MKNHISNNGKECAINAPQVDNKKSSAKADKDFNDYTPKYSEEMKEKLKSQTEVCEHAIIRIINDESIGATPFNDGKNCIIDVRKISDRLFFPTLNRTHGVDEKKTGESVMIQGAQLPLIVITGDMAKAAGIPYERFSNDPDKDKVVSEENLFVAIEGNGRLHYLMDISKENWPAVYAILPSKDASGYYNINKVYDDINTNISPWKVQDMVQKRILTDQENVHPGWCMINQLVKQGYKYQAACQLCTLNEDRLKKVTVVNGSDEEIFKNYNYAKEIFGAELEVFSDDTDVLKTKMFTKEVSHLWKTLEEVNGGKDATDIFIRFIKGLSDEKVKAIKEAKSEKGSASKDERRKTILNQEFFKFVGANDVRIA